MPKMGSYDPFGYLKHKLWPKEGLSITKSQDSPRFPCVQVACHKPLKSFRREYNFGSNPISIEALHTKLWAAKVAEVLISRISKLPFGSLRTKCHLDAGPVARHKIYYKGKSGGFSLICGVKVL
jgi:hypothetical protein